MTGNDGSASFDLDSYPVKFRVTSAGQNWFSEPLEESGTVVISLPAESAFVRGSSLVEAGGLHIRPYQKLGSDYVYLGYTRQLDPEKKALCCLPGGFFRFRVSILGREFFSHINAPSSVSLPLPPETVVNVSLGGTPVSSRKIEICNLEGSKIGYSKWIENDQPTSQGKSFSWRQGCCGNVSTLGVATRL